MHRRTFPKIKAVAVVGFCALVSLSLGLNASAASEQKPVADTVTAPSAMIKWDHSAQNMSTVEAAQAAQLLEQFRQKMEAGFVATGRLVPADELKGETMTSGLKKARATVDMLSFSVVRVGEDNELVQACTDGPAAAEELLATPVADAKEEK